MASVYRRNEVWYVRYKDGHGKWRSQASTATSKTEARRLAGELERRAERQRLGLEPFPVEDGGGTVAELLAWWLETYVTSPKENRRLSGVVRRHFDGSELASLRLVETTSQNIEVFLQERSSVVKPNTLNHLRGYLCTAFSRARQAGRWSGANPVMEVRRRKVPRRLPTFLRVEEVPRVLAVLSPQHRPLFATALYTGMRKGELAGLRKTDVDFGLGLINVCRSYDHDTTKSGRAEAIPMADELRSYLEKAIAASPSEYVFPGVEGALMSENNPLEKILRRALRRAGIVTGYVHVCRKKGCGHSELAPDNDVRRCPVHDHKLWPKAQVRAIRFHDLRHSTASLLLMAGASPAAVQRILRHSDPRITMDVYGHLVPGFLRDEVNRLSFGAPPTESQAVASASTQLVTTLLQDPPESGSGGEEEPVDPPEISEVLMARPAGLEPATSGLESNFGGLALDSNELQVTETVRVGTSDRVQRVARKAAIRRQLVTSLLQDAAGNEGTRVANSSGESTDQGSKVSARLMTVKEVAKALRVCTATVYGMIEKGELEHFRVSNAIRVVVRLP